MLKWYNALMDLCDKLLESESKLYRYGPFTKLSPMRETQMNSEGTAMSLSAASGQTKCESGLDDRIGTSSLETPASGSSSVSSTRTRYSVFLFTRPLSYATLFSLGIVSDGKAHLRHWGVLVTEMSLVDAQALFQRSKPYGSNDYTELGVMYELFRDELGKTNANINPHFGMEMIRKEWQMFSAEYIGETIRTHDGIKKECMISFISGSAYLVALRIIEEHPDYGLYENNCQNFVKYLLEFVCPGAVVPATIQNVLQRLQEASLAASKRVSIPGAYPSSRNSTVSTSYVTASETSWLTASGDTWMTAVDCSSICDSVENMRTL